MILFLIVWGGVAILIWQLNKFDLKNSFFFAPFIALVAGVAFVVLHMELNYRAWDDPTYVSERHIAKVTEVSVVIVTDGKNEIPCVILPSASHPDSSRLIALQANCYFQRNITEGEKFYFVHHGCRFIGPVLILPSRVLTDTKPEFSSIFNEPQ